MSRCAYILRYVMAHSHSFPLSRFQFIFINKSRFFPWIYLQCHQLCFSLLTFFAQVLSFPVLGARWENLRATCLASCHDFCWEHQTFESQGYWLGQHLWQELRVGRAKRDRPWKRQIARWIEKFIFPCCEAKFTRRSGLQNYVLHSSTKLGSLLETCDKAVTVLLMFGIFLSDCLRPLGNTFLET